MPADWSDRIHYIAIRLRLVALGVYVGLLGMAYRTWPNYETSPDWILWRSLGSAISNGTIYHTGTEAGFVWSPVAVWIMALVPTIFWPWLVLHFAVVLLLRDWRFIVLVFLSWGFWTSTASGHPFVFIFVAGALALRGSRPAALVYLALCFLMPRPVQLPLAIWLIWKMPDIRMPAVAIFLVHSALVLASGYTVQWLVTLVSLARDGLPIGNYGPSALIGSWWSLVGIPLGVWLTKRGHVGFAGLAVSPYWLPEYLMMALLDLVPARRVREASRAGDAMGGRIAQRDRGLVAAQPAQSERREGATQLRGPQPE